MDVMDYQSLAAITETGDLLDFTAEEEQPSEPSAEELAPR